MATYFGTSINESATIVLPAGEKITGAQSIALAVKADGSVGLPAAKSVPIGLTLRAAEENYEQGEDVTLQVKDIGKWTAAEKIIPGNLLAADATGKAKVATAGDFILAVALTGTENAGTIIQVQIIKAGFLPAGA